MAARVEWASEALDDLESIKDYIAHGSSSRAGAMVQRIRDAVESLRKYPLQGRMVPEWEEPSLRQILVRPYRVIYGVETDRLTILRVIHGARDLGRAWQNEDDPPSP